MQEYEVSGYLLSWIEDWRVRKDLPAGSQDAPDGEGLIGVSVLRLNHHLRLVRFLPYLDRVFISCQGKPSQERLPPRLKRESNKSECMIAWTPYGRMILAKEQSKLEIQRTRIRELLQDNGSR